MEREYLIGFYRVDEALPLRRIAIEVDGCYWHGCQKCGFSGRPAILNLDRRKTTYLSSRGWKIIRIPVHAILQDLAKVVEEVLEAIHVEQ